jgi:hypothetical protein
MHGNAFAVIHLRQMVLTPVYLMVAGLILKGRGKTTTCATAVKAL